jgi:hypothetical protein
MTDLRVKNVVATLTACKPVENVCAVASQGINAEYGSRVRLYGALVYSIFGYRFGGWMNSGRITNEKDLP